MSDFPGLKRVLNNTAEFLGQLLRTKWVDSNKPLRSRAGSRIFIDSSMSSPWYVKRNSLTRSTKVTKKASNSLDQERLEYPVSPTCPAIAWPSSPRHPGSSIMMDGHFEDLLTEEQTHHNIEREYTGEGRCTYILCAMASHRPLTVAM